MRLKAITAKATPTIAQTPAARPSTPSEKLTTFIIPTRPIAVSVGAAAPKRLVPEQRERDVGDVDAADGDGDGRRADLARELDRRMEVEAVVERADRA